MIGGSRRLLSERRSLVCDFDGTIAVHDLGDAICERFADPSWLEVRDQWRAGKLTLPEAQDRMWSTVRASREELLSHAEAIGELRAGVDELFEAAAKGELELVIASGGFDLYIEHLLGDRLRGVTLYCNRLLPSPEGARLEFPHVELARDPFAIDKALVLERHPGAFAGDGRSDRSVVASAELLFVVEDSALHQLCNAAGRSCVPFTDFREIVAMLSEQP